MRFPMSAPTRIAISASRSDSAGTSTRPHDHEQADRRGCPRAASCPASPSTRSRSGTGSMPQLASPGSSPPFAGTTRIRFDGCDLSPLARAPRFGHCTAAMEGRRRRQLTPLSGELWTEEWTPPPVEKPRREREPKPAPSTRAGMILFGLRRFALIAFGVVERLCSLRLRWSGSTDTAAARALPRTFYFAGAFFAAVTFLGGTGIYYPVPESFRAGVRSERVLLVRVDRGDPDWDRGRARDLSQRLAARAAGTRRLK